jgi:hypothetical protein
MRSERRLIVVDPNTREPRLAFNRRYVAYQARGDGSVLKSKSGSPFRPMAETILL